MTTTRRSLLAVLAAAVGGCLSQPEEPPRTVVTEGNYTRAEPTPFPLPKPDIVTQDYVKGPDGNVVIEVELKNPQPVFSEGTLYARIEHDGTIDRYSSDFELGMYANETVTISVPINYDSFAEQPNLQLSISMRTLSEQTRSNETSPPSP